MRSLAGSLLMLALCSGLAAQQLQFDRLDSRDGLSHNIVHSLLQDQQGFLWIGTASGLNRYDGVAFTVFRHRSDDPATLSSNAVRALAEEPDGTLWVGTSGGLDRYDRRTGGLTRLVLETSQPVQDAEETTIASLAADPQGGVWAVSFQGGLYRAVPGADTATRIRFPAFVSSLAVDAEGAVWITAGPEEGATEETLRRYDRLNDRFDVIASAPWHAGAPGLGLFADGTGSVWLYSPKSRTMCQRAAPIPCLPEIEDGGVRTVAADPNGTLWFGAAEGLGRIDPTSGEFHRQRVDAAEDAWLNNNVQTLLRDRADALWVGTLSGLYRHDPYRRPFVNVDLASTPGGRDGAALAVHAETDGTLWAGTLGGGLVRVDPDGSRSRFATERTRYVWALHKDRHGTLWAGLAEDGLCAVDRRAGRLECLDVSSGLVAEDAGGMLWLAGDGVVQFDPVHRRVLRRFDWPSPRSVLEGALLVEGATVWIGADGLYRCVDDSGTCSRPNSEEQILKGLDRLSVYALHEGSDGVLWLGTTRGLARFDPATETFRTYFDAAEVDALVVYSVLEDEGGQLWLGTSAGLARFDPQTEAFRRFDPDDLPGLPEYNRRAAFKDAEGRLYFGHLDGLTILDPAAIRDNPIRPPVVITGITRTGPDGPVRLNLLFDTPLTLSYNDRLVRVEFAALNFTHGEENRYRYRLDGLDADWIDAGTERQAVYTNIPPGRYTFRVQGSNNDGLWSDEEASLALVVAPPFWQTWWFRILALLALVGLLHAAHRYRVGQLLRVERVRASISSDLHDEVGSKLAALALTSETVARRADLEAPERHRLGEMAESARRMADDLRDIVWLANPRFDTLSDLVEKMRTTADVLLDGTAHSFVCTDGEAVQTLDMERRRQLFLFYKEALRNIDRHANADKVSVNLSANDGILRLVVSDDGAGFDLAAKREATGLASLEERARALGGSFDIDTAPGNGTTVRLHAPLRRMAGFRDGQRSNVRLRSRS